MKTIYSIEEMATAAFSLREAGQSLGLVHYQGNLHRGHASLIKAAKAENDMAVLCLFPLDGQSVNDLEQDSRKAEASGADILFQPSRAALWPEGLVSRAAFGELGARLFGKEDPDHYPALCTLALKLCQIIQPQCIYYGQKDIQRYLLARRMAADLNLPLEVKCLPIIREQDNLALANSNSLLDANQRRQACLIHASLQLAEQCYAEGQREAAAILAVMEQELRKALLGNIRCLQAVDTLNLLPQERLKSNSLIALALDFGSVILTDNILLD
mgnify:CR=1 FL=1